MPGSIGFGVEFETSVKPKKNRDWSSKDSYQNFAKALTSNGLEAVGNDSRVKYPSEYDKWWITTDSSIKSSWGYSKYFLDYIAIAYYLLTNYSWNGICLSNSRLIHELGDED